MTLDMSTYRWSINVMKLGFLMHSKFILIMAVSQWHKLRENK